MTTVTNATTTSTVPQSILDAVNPKAASTDSVADATNKFMTLLVAQLKNQDPTNPMDNAQITSQLAQLSTVTGVNKLNDTLSSLKDSYSSSEMLTATNLIGHGVLVDGANVALSNSKAVFGVNVGSAADDVKIIIGDSHTGKDVQTIDLGPQQPGVVPYAWDGVPDPNNLDANGKPVVLKDGAYNIRVVATRGKDTLNDATALQFDSVTSVSTNAKDGVKLNLAVQGNKSVSDIRQVL